MDSKWERRPVHWGFLRGGLLFLATTPLVGGLWALLFPRALYNDFPPSVLRLIPLHPKA